MATGYEVRELEPAMLPDYLDFFDNRAFTDNPRWASCYCHFPHAAHGEKPWEERDGSENRAAVSGLISAGRMHGLLAFTGDQAVGWCNAGPRAALTMLDGVPMANEPTGSIVCFVVAEAHRGQGIARSLLGAACEALKRDGFALAEGYPLKEPGDSAANHRGRLEMYLAAGFDVAAEREGRVLVRKRL